MRSRARSPITARSRRRSAPPLSNFPESLEMSTSSHSSHQHVAPASTSEQPKKLELLITQAAVDAIGGQITKRGREDTSLRVGIRGGGCSGFSYVIEFHDGPPNARDVVYDLTTTSGSAVRVVV